MIGKIFCAFSNDWKKFSGNKRDKGDNDSSEKKDCQTITAISDNCFP